MNRSTALARCKSTGASAMRSIPSRHLLVALVVAYASVLAVAANAQAGTYIMRTCNVPGNGPAPVGPWKWEYAYHSTSFDECSSGGGFGFWFPNELIMPRVSSASLLLERETNGPRSAIALRQVKLWLVARLSGTGSFLYVVTRTATASSSTQTDVFGPPGGDTVAYPLVSPILPLDTRAFRVALACSGSSWYDCYPASRRPLELRGAEVTLEEQVPPTASILGGTALAGGSRSGLRSVSYATRDDESGIARIEALLGDSVAGVRDVRGACSYTDFTPCPTTEANDLPVDTRAVPDGSYPLRLRVTDAAGNKSITQSSSLVKVANGSATRLEAHFTSTRRRTLTTAYGKRVSIRGRLTDSHSRVLKKAHVRVQHRRATAGSHTRDRGLVTTDDDGRWRYNLSKHVSSRELTFRYGSSVTRLNLRVRAAAALRVSLRGTLVRYGGRVVSKPVPSKKFRVSVQGRARGSGWQTFATPRVNRTGRFSGRYRLRVRRPGVTLQFRVRVRGDRRYPFVPGSSDTVSRVVR